MKTSLLLLFFSLLVTSPIFAQITLTTTDLLNMFAVGKGQKEISAADTATYTMNVGTAPNSSQQTWTLPTAQFKDTTLIINVAPSSTPYANKFPLATHALTVSQGDASGSFTYYGYYRIANDSAISLGSANRMKYGTIDTTTFNLVSQFMFKMPIALGTVTTIRDSSYFGPGNYEIRNATETYDAFGTITLPNGTFPCLRSRQVQIKWNYSGGTLAGKDTSISFSWLTKEGHSGGVYAKNRLISSGTIQVGSVKYTAIVNATVGVPEGTTSAPNTFALLQNYPNPFNPSTVIRYSLPERSRVTVEIYNMLGQRVTTLVNTEQEAQYYEVTWVAANIPSGMYFCRIAATAMDDNTKQYLQVRRMMLLK